MADVAVKKQKEITKPGETELATRWAPFSWWTPSQFFSNPFSVMRRFSEEMERAFGRENGGRFWSPEIEVTEANGQLKIHADLPGLKPEDVRVEVENDQLIIQGERKYEHEEKKKGFYRSERHYGQFYRAIPLPEGANTEQAKAQFSNGVLEISMPVPEETSNRRQIPVESK